MRRRVSRNRELMADIREHLYESLGSPPHDEIAVRAVLLASRAALGRG